MDSSLLKLSIYDANDLTVCTAHIVLFVDADIVEYQAVVVELQGNHNFDLLAAKREKVNALLGQGMLENIFKNWHQLHFPI